MQATDDFVPVAEASLLWPPTIPADRRRGEVALDAGCVRDLALPGLIVALGGGGADRTAVESVLLQLPRDVEVIRYRQDVTADLLADPSLTARLLGLLPALASLTRRHFRGARGRSALEEVVWRLGELQSFVDCVTALHDALAGSISGLRSAGFLALQAELNRISADETYQNLVRELPDLLAQVRTTASITIGVNLDDRLQPVEATLLSINDKKFRASSFLDRLFGSSEEDWQGIAPLHSVPDQIGTGASAIPISSSAGSGFTPLMVPLFRDLAQILEKAARPIAAALQRYGTINGGVLDGLSRELPFFLGGVRLLAWLRERGLSVCRPELGPEDDRICQVREAYNVNLALQLGQANETLDLRTALVTNDVVFGPASRVLIVTGPNGGGKTTYIQEIGVIQVLAQAGLYVPGLGALISPVDGIYTHFPTEENLAQGTGRFGDEAQRLNDIFKRVTRHSLVLLNESLASTSAGESLYLAQDIVRVLRLLGARAIFSTHLHELAAELDELNAAEPGDGQIASLVASPVPDARESAGTAVPPLTSRSYRIVFGPPLGRSYATEIARQYGVSYEQLRDLLAARGLLPT